MRTRRYLTVHSLDASEEPSSSAQAAPAEEPVVDQFSIAREALKRLNADFLIYCGEIQFGHELDLERLLDQIENPADEVILWLTTPGGYPDTAYSMARLLQRRYRDFTIYINGWCKSSGTLMCLGANKIVMGDLGQLGPLDIQIINREEFGERHSGLNPIEALKSISYQSIELLRQQFLEIRFGGGLSTRQALEVATNLTGALMSPITSQLDIMKYGEFTISMRIANEYGNRLAKYHNFQNIKQDAINSLTTGYPSHGFVIDREEACERIFNNVVPPVEELRVISDNLQTVIDKSIAGHNNRALLIDLRHALGVSFPAPLDETRGDELNSAEKADSDEEIVAQPVVIETAVDAQTTEAEIIPLPGLEHDHEDRQHGTPHDTETSAEDGLRKQSTGDDSGDH